MQNHDLDSHICLGDIVGYGPDPNACTERVKEDAEITICGNHDLAATGGLSTEDFNLYAKRAMDWTRDELTDANRQFLSSLPLSHHIENATLVHASPAMPEMWYYITSLDDASEEFHYFDTAFCFVGHTHVPYVVVKNELQVSMIKDNPFRAGPGDKLLVNVGSVGQPRDENADACYLIYDSDKKEICFHRVQYDIRKTQEKMAAVKLPSYLSKRLTRGQ